MDTNKLISRLVEHFGDNVIVRSQHHVQVKSPKGFHDIWIDKFHQVKFKLAGNRNVIENARIDQIINSIKPLHKTHLEEMQETLDFAKFVDKCQKKKHSEPVIYTDAGFKAGKARIAAVFIDGDKIEAKSIVLETENSSTAELGAINLGLMMAPNCTVYNDNQSVVSSLINTRVKWLPRESNKAADKIGNFRGTGLMTNDERRLAGGFLQ